MQRFKLRSHPRGWLSATLAFAALAGPLAFALLRDGSQAAGATPAAIAQSYPVLSGQQAPDITLFAHALPAGSQAPAGPAFPMNPPSDAELAAEYPVASSIRPITTSLSGIRAWVAQSYSGGICVLAWDGQAGAAVAFSCSSAANRERGATVEMIEMPAFPGATLLVGVVPSAVKAVDVATSNDGTHSIVVHQNAWALLTSPAEGHVVSQTSNGG